MDHVAEFLADWAFRQERDAAERERLAALAEPIKAARAKLPQLIENVVSTLAVRLGGHAEIQTGAPFFETKAVLMFSRAFVWFDIDQHEHNPTIMLCFTDKAFDREPNQEPVDVLDLDEESAQRKMISALRRALGLRGRPKTPTIWRPE